MLSFILKLKAKYDAAQVKAEQKRIDAAKERVKKRKTVQQAKQEKEQEKEEKKGKSKQEDEEKEERKNEAEREKEATEDKKDEELAKKKPNKFMAVMSNVASGFMGFFESLPVVFFVIKIIAIVLVLVIIANIIFSAMSAITNVVVDTTLGAVAAMDFTNAFDAAKMSSGTDENGEYRIYFQKGGGSITTIEDDPDDPDPPPEYITDIDLWCNITDTQIKTYIVEAKWSSLSPQLKNEYFNLLRMVRMAYRICYAEKPNGERYLKGIKPQTLLGILFFEKGYGWMQVNSCTGALHSECGSDGEWYYLDGTTWKTTTGSTDYTKTNVDSCIAGCYMHGHDQWNSGPLSWDYGWDTMMEVIQDSADYTALLAQLLEYPEYASMKSLSPIGDTSSTSVEVSNPIPQTTEAEGAEEAEEEEPEPVEEEIDVDQIRQLTISSLFYNLLCTAVRFDSQWWDGTTKLNTGVSCTGYKNAFLYWFGDVDTSTCSVSQIQTLGNNFAKPDSSDYFELIYGTAEAYYGDSITDTQYNDWVSEMANMLYYQYHHFPSWDTVYDYCYAYWSKDSNGNLTPTLISELDYSLNDYYCSLTLLFAAYLTVMEGHTMNALVPDLAYVSDGAPVKVDDNGTLLPQEVNPGFIWTPLGTDCSSLKSILAGGWMYYDDYPDCTTGYTGYKMIDKIVADDFISFGGGYTSTCKKDSYLNITTDRTNVLDTSLWNYVDTYDDISVAWGISHSMDLLWQPISFAAVNEEYPNLHEMQVGGAGVSISGANIIRSLSEALYEWVPGLKPPDPEDDPDPIEIDITNLLGAPVYTAGKAYVIEGFGENNHIQLGKVVSPVFPVTDRNDTTAGVQNCFGATYTLQNGYGEYAGGGNHNGVDIPQSASATGDTDITQSFCDEYLDLLQNAKEYISFDESCAALEEAGKSDLLTNRQEVIAVSDGIVEYVTYSNFINGEGASDGNNYYIRHFFQGSDGKVYEITYGYYHLCPDHIAIYTQAYNSIWETKIDETFANGLYYGGSYKENPDRIADGSNTVIKEGSLLGYMGSTGRSDGTHLHLDLRKVSVFASEADVEGGKLFEYSVDRWDNKSDFNTNFANRLDGCYSIFMGYDNSKYKHGSGRYPLHTDWLESFSSGTFALDYDLSDISAFEAKLD